MSTNSQQWNQATPGYIIFLIDQSGSMAEKYTEEATKAEFTSLVINRTIDELIHSCSDGEIIKDRLFISLIGYGGKSDNSIEDITSEYISYFPKNPIRFQKNITQAVSASGALVDMEEHVPIYLEAVAKGLTPMGEAFKFAKELIEGWILRKPENPAPIIINISDGHPDDPSNTIRYANEIKQLSTADGNPIIFNIHIQKKGIQKGFEKSDINLHEANEKLLFKISSKIPAAYVIHAKKAGLTDEFDITTDSSGYISNAKPETLVKFINFGSSR